MKKRKLVIRPADQWHQPDFKDAHEMVVDPKVDQNIAGTILMLNDDCLLKVLKCLPTLDLLQAEKVCWRFRSVAEMVYKSHKVFDSEEYYMLDVPHLRSLLYNVGPYVQTVRVKFHFNSSRNVQVLRFAALYCSNVTVLQLCGIEVSYRVKNVQNLFRSLTKLEIEACSVKDQDLIYLLQASENNTITEINFSSNQLLNGKCLPLLSNVRVANLYSCSNMQPRYFMNFLKENKDLEELNIVLCDQLNVDCIRQISKLSNLKKLAISNGYSSIHLNSSYSALKELKSLRHLEIRYVNYGVLDNMLLEFSKEVPLEYLDLSCGPMTKTLLQALLNFTTLRGLKLNRKKDCDDEVIMKIAKLKTLEEFSIAACHNVSDEGVLQLVRLNPKIRFVDVSYCHNLMPELVSALVEITKDRSHVLTLRVGGTDLNEPQEDNELDVKVADNLKLELSSTYSTYLGSSDEASSDEWSDYDYWDDDDYDDSSELSADSEYVGRLLFDILRDGHLDF